MNFWKRFASNLLAAAAVVVFLAIGVGGVALLVQVPWLTGVVIVGLIVGICALDALRRGE